MEDPMRAVVQRAWCVRNVLVGTAGDVWISGTVGSRIADEDPVDVVGKKIEIVKGEIASAEFLARLNASTVIDLHFVW
jgi:hypothetical protein